MKVLLAWTSGRTVPGLCTSSAAGRTWPCGVRGEFHGFAWDGPAFRKPVPVRAGDVVEREGFVFADLLPAAS